MQLIGKSIVVFPEAGRVVVKPPKQEQVLHLMKLPDVKELDGLVELSLSEDSCRLLMDLGIPDALHISPLMYSVHSKVEGVYRPMQHQLLTAAFVAMHPRCYVLSDPRTGKTGSLVLAMDYLQRSHTVAGAWLVVATVTTMRSVWAKSIESTLPSSITAIAHGPTRETALFTRGANFIITNYDSIRISEKAFTYAVQKGFIGGIVLDELTHLGRTSSRRHKAFHRLVVGTNMHRVIGLTGSPAANTDAAYGMAHIVNPDRLPCKSFKVWQYMTSFQPEPGKPYRLPRYNAPDIIYSTLQPAIRFRKQDIIDLPPIMTQTRECDLSAKQAAVYRALKSEAKALAESGEVITASNGGVLFGKLMQAALGVVIDDKGDPVPIDNEPRVKAIQEAIAETSRKVVIMCCYTAAIDDLKVKLSKAGISTAVIDGRVSGGKRAELLEAFQTTDTPRVLICHPTTTAYGVELSAADTLIFNGAPPLGGFIYAQALERLSSAKQDAKSIQIIRIVSTYEEKKMFRRLDDGKELSGFVNELFEEYRGESRRKKVVKHEQEVCVG